jgi:hypothetical protein
MYADPWFSVNATHNIRDVVHQQMHKQYPNVIESFIHIGTYSIPIPYPSCFGFKLNIFVERKECVNVPPKDTFTPFDQSKVFCPVIGF